MSQTKTLQSSITRLVRTTGCSVADKALLDRLLTWISPNSETLANTSVVLFDSHSFDLAQKCIDRKARSVLLFEGYQQNAQRQKLVVEETRARNPDSATSVEAFHGSMNDVLVPKKSKPLSHNLWMQLFASSKVKTYRNYKSDVVSTVFVGNTPFPTQQSAILNSLLEQLLIYYGSNFVNGNGKKKPSMFHYGKFAFLTFLHPSQFGRLCSACPPDTLDLSFFKPNHRHFSFLFNRLFNVEAVADSEGFPVSLFAPTWPPSKFNSYAKKMTDIGFAIDRLYPVKIEPKKEVVFPNMKDNNDFNVLFDLPANFGNDEVQLRSVVLAYAYWMLQTARLKYAESPDVVIKDFLGPRDRDDTADNHDVLLAAGTKPTPAELDQLFPAIWQRLDKSGLSDFYAALQKGKQSEKGCID